MPSVSSLDAGAGTLAVAGNAHTRTRPTDLGFPLGACLARQRPGVLDIRIGFLAKTRLDPML